MTKREMKKRRMLCCPFLSHTSLDSEEDIEGLEETLAIAGLDNSRAVNALAEFLFCAYHPRKNEYLRVRIEYGEHEKDEWSISATRRRK